MLSKPTVGPSASFGAGEPIAAPANTRIFSNLAAFGDRTCLIDRAGTSLSYREVADRADAVFADPALPSAGLAFIQMANTIDSLLAYIGAIRRGYAVLMLDPVKTSANAALIENFRPDVLVDPSGAEPVTVRSGSTGVHPAICTLLSTSGSTGSAKLVKLTDENIASNTASIIQYLGLTPEDRGVTSLKPFYSYGMSVVNTHLQAGASLVISDLSVDDPTFWTDIRDHGVTNIAGVPFSFELIYRNSLDLAAYPSLRFLTQAGGRLSGDLIRHFALTGQKTGIAFYVMYGQTEAGPRMAYLPPDLAPEFPGSIGKPIPGGRLWVVSEDGDALTEPNTSGELVYAGPNVMGGYARNREDLATLEIIPSLRTGDIAHFDENGLFYIEGRTSRFVKPFGLRISLDEIERQIAPAHGPVAATGTDHQIVVAIEDALDDPAALAEELAARNGLPASIFTIAAPQPVPRLASGKPDYMTLLSWHIAPAPRKSAPHIFLEELTAILTGRSTGVDSVLAAFQSVLGRRVTDSASSFRSLGGDSLTFMQVYLQLEDYLGAVPQEWDEMSIAELESLKVARVD